MSVQPEQEVTDDQLETQLSNLYNKSDRTEDEAKQLDELKTQKNERYQKRINEIKSNEKLAKYRAEEAEEKARKAEEELVQLRANQVPAEPIISKKETVDADGEKWYTDGTLTSMMKSGELSEAEAIKHQQDRQEAKASDRAYKRIKGEQDKTKDQDLRNADMAKVYKDYPHFSKKLPDGSINPKYNPDDPLFKEANTLWQSGLYVNPKGLSLAIDKAKKILGLHKKSIDISDELSALTPGGAPSPIQKGQEEIVLTDEQKEQAIRMWRNLENPKTRRNYTEPEAIEKYKNSLAKRRTARIT